MDKADYARLERSIATMEDAARSYGLDFFAMRYEVCPADVVYTIAGFGMPTRYSHWSFGKQYHRQKVDFDFGLSRIYELVVNNDPCYAFLLDTNTVLQNELIVAHVLGHSDFFKNNSRFARTNRFEIEAMAATAQRFRCYEERYGVERLESVLDAALSLQEHIDPSLRARWGVAAENDAGPFPRARTSGEYDDLIRLGRIDAEPLDTPSQARDRLSCTEEPELDLLRVIVEDSPILEDWERDVVATVRQEMLYFWPQLETKVMNEGWASFWHNRIMRDMDLSPQDAVDFAQLTSGVTQPHPFRVNPYHLGLKIWEALERQYGMDKLFEVRECDSDVSFLRNYLSQDIVDDCQLYKYERKGNAWVITERGVDKIRDTLVAERTHCGFPTLHVLDRNHRGLRGLLLHHAHEGRDLDARYIARTLPAVKRLWGQPVTLQALQSGRGMQYVCESDEVTERAV